MGKNKKIVIIDDNKDYVFTMKTFLERNGFDVVSAENGKLGIDLVKKEKPDLILLDVMMEILFSGFEVYRQLKIDPELKNIPLIGVSGMADDINVKFDKEKDSEYFNPDEFMEKPVDKDLLLKKINELLEKV
jgi:CheY-like chemotaxis protein